MQDCKHKIAKLACLQERIHKKYIDFLNLLVYDIIAKYGMPTNGIALKI